MNQNRPETPRPVPVPVNRLVLKCRCGGLYLDPSAHRDAFGHPPDPVRGAAGHQAEPVAS